MQIGVFNCAVHYFQWIDGSSIVSATAILSQAECYFTFKKSLLKIKVNLSVAQCRTK